MAPVVPTPTHASIVRVRHRVRSTSDAAARTCATAARLLLGVATVLVVFVMSGAAVFVIGAGVVSGWDPSAVAVAVVVATLPSAVVWHYRRTLIAAASLPQRVWRAGRAAAGPVVVSELRRSAVSAAVSRSRNPLRLAGLLRRSAGRIRGAVPGAGLVASLPYHLTALACIPIAGWLWFLGVTGTVAALTL